MTNLVNQRDFDWVLYKFWLVHWDEIDRDGKAMALEPQLALSLFL